MKGTGSWGIGAALQSAKGGTISHCYAVESSVYPRAFYDTGSISISNQGVVKAVDFKFATEEALLAKLPVRTGQTESLWECCVDADGNALGTPILKMFSSIWMEKQ